MNSPAQTKQPATKPAHTPSAGAMRAAKEVWHENQIAFPRERDLLPLAQIIDRETARAELVAALELALERLTSANGRLEARGRLGYRTDDLTAALAKAQA